MPPDIIATCLYAITMHLCVKQNMFFPSAGITIGFDQVTYSVLEDAGSANVTVSILSGNLARNAVVTLLVSGGTATGKI